MSHYEHMQEAIQAELERQETRVYTEGLCAAYGFASDADDVRNEVFASICKSSQRNSGKAKAILAWTPNRLRNYVRKAIRNAAHRLHEKHEAEMRKLRARFAATGDWSAAQATDDAVPLSLERRDAKRILCKVDAKLGCEGKFALKAILSGKTAEALAPRFGVSESTGRRRFRRGLPLLERAIEAVLGQEFGDEAQLEFIRLAAIFMQSAHDHSAEEEGEDANTNEGDSTAEGDAGEKMEHSD